eukprot:11224194-Lingulodinium_polyedra.AAC.1
MPSAGNPSDRPSRVAMRQEREAIYTPRPLEEARAFALVHAFSGRRRKGDLQWRLDALAKRSGVRVVVASVDP